MVEPLKEDVGKLIHVTRKLYAVVDELLDEYTRTVNIYNRNHEIQTNLNIKYEIMKDKGIKMKINGGRDNTNCWKSTYENLRWVYKIGIKINRKLEEGKRKMVLILKNSNQNTKDDDIKEIRLYKLTVKRIRKHIRPIKWKLLDSLRNMYRINKRNNQLGKDYKAWIRAGKTIKEMQNKEGNKLMRSDEL